MEGSSEIITKYLEGRCSPEEKLEFERLKREDAAFAEEVKWYEMAYAAIELGSRERRREELLEIASKDKPEAKKISMFNNRTYMYAIAAAVALLFMVYIFTGSEKQAISSQELWAMNTAPIEINAGERGEILKDSSSLVFVVDSLIEEATVLHQSGECEKAQNLWNEVADISDIDEYRLSIVICYLNGRKSSQALETLGGLEDIQIQKGDDAEDIDDVISWCKIIAYLQQYEDGQEVEADLKKELLHYQEEGYFQYADRVKEILESIE